MKFITYYVALPACLWRVPAFGPTCSCGNVCGKGLVCRNDACTCPNYDETLCGDKCIALTASDGDVNNCGSCGYVCPKAAAGAYLWCDGGSCAQECYDGHEQCGSSWDSPCIDFRTDDNNCGRSVCTWPVGKVTGPAQPRKD